LVNCLNSIIAGLPDGFFTFFNQAVQNSGIT
jgi:hypothetical protein